jgi:hypothetical protein
MSGTIPPFPQYAFMAWCSKYRDNFTFIFYFKTLILRSVRKFVDVFHCQKIWFIVLDIYDDRLNEAL